LLGQVGRAVVVHPHRKLKRLAMQQGWTIVNPRRPQQSSSRFRRRGSTSG